MKKLFWILILIFLSTALFSQKVEYAYPRKSYLNELSEPSRTVRDDAPEIIATGNVNYIIGSSPVIVAPNITLSNFSSDFEGMKIYFTNNFHSNQDILELTQNFGGVSENYDQSTGILILQGSHDATFWQNVCRQVQYRNTSGSPIQEIRDVTFTLISAIFIPSTGHYYEFVSNYGISWTESKDNAAIATYYGLQGYLATVTSAEENFFITTELGGVGWIGGSDHEEHDHWKWISGPDAGIEYWEGRYPSHPTLPGAPVNGMYSNWNNGEPNHYFGNNDPEMWEDYCHMIYNPSVGPIGSWNDLPDAGTSGNFTPYGYVVEYGGMPGDPELHLFSTVTVTVTDLQVTDIQPSAGGDITIDELESIAFSIAAYDPGGSPLSYSWKLDDTEVSTSNNYNFTTDYSSAGSHDVLLYVHDNDGSELSYNWNVTVNDIDQNIIVNEILPSAGGSISINELESIAFSIDASDPDGNPLIYNWQLDGTQVSTTDSYSFTTDYSSAGSYVVTLDVTDNFSDNSLNYTWNITVNDVDQTIVVNQILPSAGGSITINELESIAFSIDAYDPDGNPLIYNWELDGTQVSTTDSYSFTTDYTSAGSYVVTLNVTDNYSDNSLNYTWNITVIDVDQNIVVNEILPSAGGSITINELESIAFSIDAIDPDGNTLVYNWQLDGTQVSTTDSYNFTTDYTSADSYVVTLGVTDNFSDNAINYTWNITVIETDQNIVITEILPSAGGSITINELETIAFSIDAYDPDGNTLVYNWQLDGTQVSTTDSYNFTTDYSSAGSYVVTLGVTDNFSDNSLNYTWNITVNDVDQNIVVNEILPSAGSNITINELENIAFSIDAYDPDGNTLVYNWQLNGTQVSTTDSYNFTTDYSSAGSYVVTLGVTDNFSDNSLNYTWNITVNDVDQNIVVNEILPSAGGSITINELESIAFSIDAYDPDGNTLVYNWQLDGTQVSTTNSYNFTTDYTSAGSYIVTLGVTDNYSDNSINYTWNITVDETDQNIIITEILPSAGGSLTINELESIAFSIDAYDPDGNPLEYNWELDGTQVSTTDSYNFTTDYTSSGSYIVSLDVTDNFSENTINYTWDITVNDVDQYIVVNEILPSAGGSITIDELESIAFSIDAYDPDGNTLVYNWQLDGTQVSINASYTYTSDYTSAGSHLITLLVTDNFSDNSLNYSWDITVNDVDQYIVVDDIQPAPGEITIDEMETINFFIDAYDPDGNTLEYRWDLDGTQVSTTDSYDFTTDYTSAGIYSVTLAVADNFSDNSLNYIWDITVNDLDQNIVINEILPSAGGDITIEELESIAFSIDAHDPDGNPLEYNWELDGTQVSTTASYNFTTDYSSAGSYIVTLEVTDNYSDNTINYTWDITVNDVDQYIIINEILPSAGGSITINELESIAFLIDAYDPDGNPLTYNWELDGSIVSNQDYYQYISNYNSAGVHTISLEITDNFASDNTLIYTWNITVNDVDRPIIVNELIPESGSITMNEGETIDFSIDAIDPDGNPLEYSWQLDGTEVSNTANYSFITDFNSAGLFNVTLNVTDNFLTDNTINYSWEIVVEDVDQEIVVDEILPEPGNLFIQESESINFSIDAYDPDGNVLEYNWELDGTTVSTTDAYEFTTDMNSAGIYFMELFVTDNYSDNALQFDWNITVLDGGSNIIVTNIDPAPGALEIFENDNINFLIEAYAFNGNDLTYDWQLDGSTVSSTNTYLFTTDFTSAGEYQLSLEVEDEQSADTILNFIWNVIVFDSDQQIVVDDIQPVPGSVTISETETIDFFIDAYDPDGNPLEYSWKLDSEEMSTVNTYEFITDLNSAGLYLVTLDLTDNFGENALYYEWNVTVLETDQSIVIDSIQPEPGDVTTLEGEVLEFYIDAYDPDGNELEYNWELDGAQVSTSAAYNFLPDYNAAGMYAVTLNVTDNFLADNSIDFSWNVTVIDVDQEIVVIELIPAQTTVAINEGESIDFSINAIDPDGNDLTYSWNLDGTQVSTTDSYEFVAATGSVGSYVLTLIVDDNYSDSSLEFVWDITVLDPSINIIINEISPAPGNLTISETEIIEFFIDAYTQNGDDLSYSWMLDGTAVSTENTYEFTTDFSSAGEYVITVEITDTLPPETTLEFTWSVTVTDTDQLIVVNSIEPEPGLVTMLEMETLYLSIDAVDPDGNELEYLWELDGEEVSTTNTYNFSPDYNASGEYLITLFVTDNYSDNSLEFEWNVIVEDINPNINIDAIEPSPGEFCISIGDSVNFFITADNPYGEIYYSWVLDGEEVSTVYNYLFNTDEHPVGDYYLQLIISTDAITRETLHFDWGVSVIYINQPPVADAGDDQYVDSGVLVQLDGSGSYDPEGEDLTYHWIVPEDIILSDSTVVNPTFIAPDVTGEVDYFIQLIVNDGENSSEPDEVIITVNGDSNTDPGVLPQVTELRSNYPNPFNPITTIKFDVQDNETARLTIFNLKGQVVRTETFTSGTHNYVWNAQNVSSGVYFYQLKSSTYTNTKKMILLK